MCRVSSRSYPVPLSCSRLLQDRQGSHESRLIMTLFLGERSPIFIWIFSNILQLKVECSVYSIKRKAFVLKMGKVIRSYVIIQVEDAY